MIAQTSPDILEWLNAGGVVGLLVVIVSGALRGWWVPGATHARVLGERDRFLELALRSASAAEGVTEVMQAQQKAAQDLAVTAAAEVIARAKAEGKL